MGEEVGGVPEAAPVGAAGAGPDDSGTGSVGRYLASQRQLRDISVVQLAALTKIPVRSLERLEAGAFDRVPDGFARGFVRTVAEALGLDPDDAVMRLMREPPDEKPPARYSPGSRAPLVGAGLVLAGALLVLALWKAFGALPEPVPDGPARGVILRRDPVRSLAREQAQRARESVDPSDLPPVAEPSLER